jgi:alpha-mannosidase
VKSTKILWLLVISMSTALAQQPKKAANPKVTDVWVVFKTHFDLGFTDLPENVFRRYREEMMDNALAVIEKSATLPQEKRFAWTVSGWPLQAQILGPLQTPGRRVRIEQAIKTGALAVHGLPFTTHTESLDNEDLVRGLGYSSAITRKYGLPMTISAKMTDVPSHSWILPTLLYHAGIKFLQLGCNPASQYPRFPELFWWEGADGSKILCNYTALYGSDIKPTENWPCKNYLAMQMTGDNHGPPTSVEIDKLLAYAAKEMPGVKIHFGTLDDFARAVLAEHADLPTVKGDCPDTWIQGIQANPQETKIARNIRPLESALDALNTQMNGWGISTAPLSEKLAKAYEQSLLYGEHTWGMNAEYGPRYSYGDDWKKWMEEVAAEPIPENGDYAALKNSDANNTATGSKKKWLHSYDEKRQYILNTNDIVSKELHQRLDLLASSISKNGRRFVVYNPLPWKRSGMVENPWQKGRYCYVKDIPPSGYVSYSPDELSEQSVTKDEQPAFTTPYFKVVFDLRRGGISSLIEKSTGRELVDQSAAYVMGQFLHERFSTHEVDKWFNAYSRVKDGWGLNDLGKPGMISAEKAPYLAFTPGAWKIDVAHTSIADIVTLTAVETAGHAKHYTLTFTFPRHAAYVDVSWAVTSKTPDKQPEGGWLCFPFNVKQPTFTVGRPGGPINPATDIIPGCNRYLMAANSGVSVTQPDKSGMALSSADAPLISAGEPGLWKYSMDYIPRTPTLFVNLYNNMWNTNFPLWQDGSWSESVRLWPVDKGTPTVANLVQYAWETRVPLLTGVAEGASGKLPATQHGIVVSRTGVLITAFGENPDGAGTILRLWEQAGTSGNCVVKLNDERKVKAVLPIDLRGNKAGKAIAVKNGSFDFHLGKYSPASFLLIYQDK